LSTTTLVDITTPSAPPDHPAVTNVMAEDIEVPGRLDLP